MAAPPYGDIWNHLKKGEVIPFLGAGASLSGRSPEDKWDESKSTILPTGRELAYWLADNASFPSRKPYDRADLAKVSSYYADCSSDRKSLLIRLMEVFRRDYKVGQIHRFLAEVPAPLLIVTTNYDDLLEKAFKEKSKPYHLIAHPTDRKDLAASVLWWKPGETDPEAHPPKSLPLTLGDTTIIYKMHGSVDRQTKKWDSFVVTEDDYVEFLSRMTGQSAIPARFMLHFCTRWFLFLGYGLRDWNLRVMLKSLKAALVHRETEADDSESSASIPEDGLRSWAIQYGPSELERMLWQARKVNIYDMEIDAFVTEMRKWME